MIAVTTVMGLTFALALFLTGALRRHHAESRRLDIPNARSSHTAPTPTGGGLAIVFAFYAAGFMLWALGVIPVSAAMFAFLGGGILIALVGYIDDKRPLVAWQRLVAHFACAATVLAFIGVPPLPFGVALPTWATALGTAFAMVWCLNLFNFMDGIDGIAVGETVTVGIAASVLVGLAAPEHAAFFALLALTAAAIGFMPWNWSPAKVFMGDVASGFIGFSVALIAVWTMVDAVLNVWAWLILPSVFFADATVTLARRLLRRERVYEAHCDHGYQCMVRLLEYARAEHCLADIGRMRAHRYVSMMTMAVTIIWLLPLAALAAYHPEWGAALTALAWAPIVWAVIMTQNTWNNLRNNLRNKLINKRRSKLNQRNLNRRELNRDGAQGL